MDKKKLTTIALFLAISTLFVVGQSVKKHVKAADEFMEKGKFEDARNQYSQAININPKDAELYTLRGKALNKMELHAEALEDFKRAAVFDEKDGDIYFYIGYTYNRLGQYDSAYTALNQASAKKTGIETIYSEKTFSLINLQRFDPALRVSDTALRSKERNSAYVFYQRGVIFENMKNMKESRDAYEDALKKDENYVDAHLALALLLVGMNEVETAMEHCNHVLGLNNKHTYANYVRSKVYVAKLEYPSAINDISKNILIEPNNPKHYIDRGIYYQEFTQHSNAINDFTKAISLDDKNPSSYLLRAKSYEEVSNYKDAARDYQKITSLSEYDIRARQLLDQANERIYEINREEDAPELVLETPIPIDNKLQIAGNLKEVILNGKIKDVSSLKSFTVNGEKVHYEGEPGEYKFIANVDIEFANKVEIVAVDTYMNKRVISLDIQRMETNAPIVKILAPYASDNNEIYLESNDPVVFLEVRLGDESPIKSIFIDGVTASYKVDELNPTFTA
ncbi:MAG: tetratricopeptide repeat protein, partial [Bacteroidales bacterium]|nr:tetratricopeptide repeat protein [Bacteroidales bacterium]